MSTADNNQWSISSTIPIGEVAVTDWQGIPLSPLVTEDILSAAPTNDWWSSLSFSFFNDEYSSPMYAHPLTLKAQSDGLSLGHTPQPSIIYNDAQTQVKYEYTYHSDLTLGLQDLNANAAHLADYSDWAVTASWADSDSNNTLDATFAHGSPYVYFEREGSANVTVNLNENTATAIGQPNQTVETFSLENINGQYQGGNLQFNLPLNATSDGSADAGNAVQARLSVDSNGDGQFDYIETYNFIPLDGDPNSTENYQHTEGRGVGADQTGQLENLSNATIKLEVWKAFGEGDIQLVTGNNASIDLPFTNLTDSSGAPLSSQLSLSQENGVNLITDNPLADGTMILGAEPDVPTVPWDGPGSVWHLDGNLAGVTINGNDYGLFAPSNSTWDINNGQLTSDLGGQDYFSAALLPDNTLGTLNYFQEHAYAFIRDTTVDFQYDQNASEVTTDFSITTELKEPGFSDEALTTLYRHQWLNTDAELSNVSYQSPRGEMKLFEGNDFSTTHDFTGVLPALPNFLDSNQSDVLYQAIDSTYQTLSAREQVITAEDTYWVGKDLGELSELTQIANQANHIEARDYFLNTIKAELEDWFTADEAPGDKQFYYNEQWGTLQGYPASFHSETQINDHHFH